MVEVFFLILYMFFCLSIHKGRRCAPAFSVIYISFLAIGFLILKKKKKGFKVYKFFHNEFIYLKPLIYYKINILHMLSQVLYFLVFSHFLSIESCKILDHIRRYPSIQLFQNFWNLRIYLPCFMNIRTQKTNQIFFQQFLYCFHCQGYL